MLPQMALFHSFLWPSDIPLYIIHNIFRIHLLDRGCFQVLAFVNSASVNFGVHVSFWNLALNPQFWSWITLTTQFSHSSGWLQLSHTFPLEVFIEWSIWKWGKAEYDTVMVFKVEDVVRRLIGILWQWNNLKKWIVAVTLLDPDYQFPFR